MAQHSDAKNGDTFDARLSAVAEIESLLILAALNYENPSWSLPKISDDLNTPIAMELGGHPLLAPESVVANSFFIDNKTLLN